jgi:hypothetical protein
MNLGKSKQSHVRASSQDSYTALIASPVFMGTPWAFRYQGDG